MVICVTNRALCKDDFLKRLTAICKAGPKFVILREKTLNEAEYAHLSQRCLTICRQFNVPLVLHSHMQTALTLSVSAIHLPQPLLQAHQKHLNAFQTVGASVHTVQQAISAQQMGATYLIAGHIFQTTCKANLPPQGVEFLKAVQSAVTIPVYPIGGVNRSTVPELQSAGIQDFCIMSELMTCTQPEETVCYYNRISKK